MAKGFFYDYREELAEKLGKKYNKEIRELVAYKKRQVQIDIAQNVIESYFKVLKDDFGDIFEVSGGEIHLISEGSIIIKLIMFKNYIKFTRFEQGIEVEIGEYDYENDLIEAKINSNIIPSEKKCVVKKIGKVHDGSHFDEKTINYYISEAFGNLKELKD